MEVAVKSYSKGELAAMYKVSTYTFMTWVNTFKAELPNYNTYQKILTPLQVRVIFTNVGEP
jgi:transposase